jgi:hypothetical protein
MQPQQIYDFDDRVEPQYVLHLQFEGHMQRNYENRDGLFFEFLSKVKLMCLIHYFMTVCALQMIHYITCRLPDN